MFNWVTILIETDWHKIRMRRRNKKFGFCRFIVRNTKHSRTLKIKLLLFRKSFSVFSTEISTSNRGNFQMAFQFFSMLSFQTISYNLASRKQTIPIFFSILLDNSIMNVKTQPCQKCIRWVRKEKPKKTN
jgi:hypothetical protein